MENSAVKIMKNISKYESMRKEAVSYANPGCYNAAYCHGWLAGVRAAMDAVLDDSSIGLMVYNAIQEQLRAEDVKEHLVGFYSYELCLKEEEVEKKTKNGCSGWNHRCHHLRFPQPLQR